MRTRLAIKVDAVLGRAFPERRIFLKSDTDTRFLRLRPATQFTACAATALLVGWSIVATATLLMDSIGSGSLRDQAERDQLTYVARLNALSAQRDSRAEEARAAQERYNSALTQISRMQTELLASETRRYELETGLEITQTNLRQTMNEREAARNSLASLSETGVADSVGASDGGSDILVAALEDTARERDQIAIDTRDALLRTEELETEIALMQDRNEMVFRQLEEAMTVSVEPLEKMFRAAGLNTDSLIGQVRRQYAGQGGPLTPLDFSARGEEPSMEETRSNRLLEQMDRLNVYRIAAEKAPFASPVKGAYRFTSPFGYRRDPKTGGRRMHKGVDFAAANGTPLYATGDGVVTHAGWSSGYGRLVKIKHAFGIETRYAHMSKLRVNVGDRVSRGDRVGDMGASGRVTGVHIHYEVRVGGKAVNPMTYIKAAKNVF